ncbi:MAG TPA: amino acid adenylation domain-containing protein [Bryobacteraceae bacterium]|nr:amino acid adenylation domain-containing protein [Bryobacteraceae bacterium]
MTSTGQRVVPLGPMQRTQVLASLRAPRSGAYVIQHVCETPGVFEVPLLQEAWRIISNRFTVLRSTIDVDRFELKVQDEPRFEWVDWDWRRLDPESREARLQEFLRDDRARGFAFGAEIPVRFAFIRTTADSSIIIRTNHHALLDGRSYIIVWREWLACYEKLAAGESVDLPEPCLDISEEPGALREDAAAESYWRERLPAPIETTGFIRDRWLDNAPSRRRYARESASLTEAETNEIWDYARRHQLSVNIQVMGAWALALSRYSGRRDVVFGVTRSCRRESNADAVGMFINTLPFRISASPGDLLGPWLNQIRADWRALRDFEQSPLDDIRRWSGLAPGASPFDTVVVYDHELMADTLRRLGGAWANRNLRRLQLTDVPLTVTAYGRPSLELTLIYNQALFDTRTIEGLRDHVMTLLRNMSSRLNDSPQPRLADIEMLDASERKWHVEECNRTAAPYSRDSCAHHLFERQAELYPFRIAMEHHVAITYGEANQRANRLARFLRERGAGAGDLIAISLGRSPDTVIAALAALKTGAAFLPLDSLPGQRLAAVLEESGAKLLLTDRAGPDTCCPSVCLSEHAAEIARQSTENLPDSSGPQSLAYAICTSGSTGKPKIVVVRHRSLVNHSLATAKVYGITPQDRRIQFASPGSDVFLAEIFTYLSSGAALVFGFHERGATLETFTRMLDEQRITITGMPSTWWREWVNLLTWGAHALPASLRIVIAGMERADPDTLRRWKGIAGHRVRWFNAYGPAETSPTTLIYEAGSSEFESESVVPVGRPIANTRAYVVDSSENIAPVGVAGELWIGGDGVALGYRNDPEATAEKFLPDRFCSHDLDSNESARLYRTGDIAYRLPDGNLVFVGRADRQAKIRGFRVELDEIESALAQLPAIDQCAVVLDDAPGAPPALVAYFTVRGAPAPGCDELRLHLSRQLPPHMIPSIFYVLEGMPETSSGKIDRASLGQTAGRRLQSKSDGARPSTIIEKRLEPLWRSALNRKSGESQTEPAVTDDFFESGGDSLCATILITLIQREFGRELSLTELLRAPTMARLASLLDPAQSNGVKSVHFPNEAGAAAIPLHPAGKLLPLFAISADFDAYCFRSISQHVGADQPVFGLTYPTSGTEASDVERMAAEICASMRQIQPHGPYALAGYCFGGLVAFEAARQLEMLGESVTLLALFHTRTPGYPKIIRARGRYWTLFKKIVLGKEPLVSRDQIRAHASMLRELVVKRSSAPFHRALSECGFNPSAGLQDPARVIEECARRYTPKPVKTRVVQFVAGDRVSQRLLEDPRLGWRDFCLGDFQVYYVHGAAHDQLMTACAPEIGSKLQTLLRAPRDAAACDLLPRPGI